MYKYYRWHVKKLISDAYRQNINNLQKSIFDEPAKFWRYVKDKRKDRRGVDVFSYDEGEVAGQAAADAFARYFGSVFQLNQPHLDPEEAARAAHSQVGARVIAVLDVSETDVITAVKRLKPQTAGGPDGVPMFLAKDCVSAFRAPLIYIYGLCLDSSMYPQCWKLSCVTPVPKGDARGDVTQYRPIAVLSVFAKIFESIVNRHICGQVDGLLHNSQHGFRRARSTTTNLVALVDYVSAEMDAGRQVDAAYFDFKKAFDLVDNDVLLGKLALLGCTPKLLRFFASYLANRRQFVKVQGFTSTEYYTRSGVSQGSTLGPTLFLIMINDLPDTIRNARCLLFADDLKLFLGVRDSVDTAALQADIDAVGEWSVANRMPFNNSKCKVITYTRKRYPSLQIYKLFDACIDRFYDICDLGLIIDSKLDFHKHVIETCKKANKTLGFIIRTSYEFNDVVVAKVLYNAYVRSTLEYAAIIWDPHEDKYSTMVERVQRKFARWLYRQQYGYYPYLYPSLFVTGMVELNLLSRRRKMLLLAYFISAFHHKIDDDVICRVDLLVPVRMPWVGVGEGVVAPRRQPQLLRKPVTRTLYGANAPTVRAILLIGDILARCSHVDLFADRVQYICREMRLSAALSVNFFRKDYTYNKERDAFYKVIVSEEENSFETAFMACDNDGSQLFYPKDNDEWKIINNLIEDMPNAPNITDILVGIRDEGVNGQHFTVDGHIVTSIVKDALSHLDCVVMDRNTGVLKASVCEVETSRRFFVCKKIDDSPCPTIDKGYIYNEDTKKCYKVNTRRKSWKDAMQTCYIEGGLLVVVESDKEANAIIGMLPHSPENDQKFHSGFRKISDKYYTLKGKNLEDSYNKKPPPPPLSQTPEKSYNRWSPTTSRYASAKLPSPPLKCGVLSKESSSQYNSLYTLYISCGELNPFICEMQARY
ncbi:uncharacterized protein LOC113239467 [Hyposmocoma kahamanoa]|uniref:uncharacterized protein LOC113239467 n=1 Tax=Hyposmocoma kahamanoa TaxID=1477025 RepID=UPI000E6D5CC5|nr:uncharacterized protein LOC113239467 [Hyposmocoma kahamanoa]